MIGQLKDIVNDYINDDFHPSDYNWVVRGGELFIISTDGKIVFNRECGEMGQEICGVFGIEAEEV